MKVQSLFQHVLRFALSCAGLFFCTSLKAQPDLPVGMNMDVIATSICEGDTAEILLITRMINGGPGVQLRNIIVTSSVCDQIEPLGGDANGNGHLDFGEEFTNICRVALADTTLVSARDQADAFFLDVFIGTVSNIDAEIIQVVHPSFDVEVTPASASLQPGGDLDLRVSVANDGDVELLNLNVSHSLLAGCNVSLPSLQVGETFLTTCTVMNVTSAFTDNVLVTADTPFNCSVSNQSEVVISVPGRIGDLVWLDLDRDGLFNNGEQGVSGITAQLLDGTNVIETTQTDTNGLYGFEVSPGTYGIRVIKPSFYDFSPPGLDSQADPGSGIIPPVFIASGGENLTRDAGLIIRPSSIGVDIQIDPFDCICAGDQVDVLITVTNDGQQALFQVSVSNDVIGCDRFIGDLAAGAATSYVCSVTVNADLINIATATGVDAAGRAVQATDSDGVDVDTDLPVIVFCPGDLAFQCLDAVPIPNTNSIVATDVCSQVTVRFLGDEAAGTCPTVITRTYAISDACGNTTNCVQTITVNDTVPPIIACPADLELQCLDDVPAIDLALVSATDNCGLPSIMLLSATTNGTCPTVIERTFIATDLCTNTATCTQTITVNDTEAPVMSCPPDLRLTADANCRIEIPDLRPPVTDNCDQTVVATQNPAPGTIVTGPAVVFVQLSAADACGNSTNCVVGVTIDCRVAGFQTAAVALDTDCLCLGDDVTFRISVTNTGQSVLSNVQVTDIDYPSCSTNMATLGVGEAVSYECTVSVTGLVNRVAFTAVGPNGLVQANGLTQWAFDTTSPIVSCPPDLTAQCLDDVPPVDLAQVQASDACGVVLTELVSATTNGVCPTVITRNFRVMDRCGNEATCSQTITVDDTEAPVISGLDDVLLVGQGPGANCQAAVPAFTPVVTDNCGVTMLTQSPVAGTILLGPGVFTVTVTAVDGCGNAATNSVEVEIECPVSFDGAIGGSVFCDGNDNGVFENFTEPAYADVRVFLFRNGLSNQVSVTDADGDYAFNQLPTGSYHVVVATQDLPADAVIGTNYLVSNDPANPFVVTVDESFEVDFGFVRPGTVEGFVFLDLQKQAATNGLNLASNPFNGVDVRLYMDDNGSFVLADTFNTITRPGGLENGYYRFSNLLAGTYRVEVDSAGVDAAMLADVGRVIDLLPTTDLSANFTFNCDSNRFAVIFGFVPGPTRITLATFSAAASETGVTVSWTTGSETDNLGYFLYRSAKMNGQRLRLNSELIGGQANGSGGSYTFEDDTAGGGRHFYWLEDIDLDGTSTLHGPAVAGIAANVNNLASAPMAVAAGITKVTHEVLAAAGLDKYEQICVFLDGREVPLVAVDGEYILFFVPEGTTRLEFGLSPTARRMESLDVSFE
ncbi:MAG: hypothetical protein ACI97B_001263 [Verrucomicrobiales bacterium]|jgi:hypothetical protein